MAKQAKAAAEVEDQGDGKPVLDSKYRLIIVAAQRSKQLQRGAHSRVDIDTQRHKPTRVALEEVRQGVVSFNFTEKL
jgi:DNA-directed RNA polymerase subunit omega